VAAKRRTDVHTRVSALPFPARPGTFVARLAPSSRSFAAGLLLLALGIAGYAAARETSVFAVRHVEVVGAPQPVAADVRTALADLSGTSLVALNGADLLRRVESVPMVYGAAYDRAFPHTLRVVVRAEQPVAVLRRGPERWLVSARGRAIARLPRHAVANLPRIWVPRTAPVELGSTLADTAGGAAARALAPLVRDGFPARVATVSLRQGELTFTLRSRIELRLGHSDDLRLKLAIARRIVPTLPPGTGYLDVSVPERPVAAPNPQVSG